MSEHATEIDVAAATAALEERLAPARETIEVARGEAGRFAPVNDATPADGEAEGQDPGVTPSEGTPAAVGQEGESVETAFTHIPDEALTPEMLAIKRSLQADYTRKTQEAAPWRKLAEEYDVEGPEQLREALDAYAALSNPANWPKLHQELTQHLVSQGMDPRAANEAAAVSLGEAVSPSPFADEDDDEPVFGADPRIESALQAQQRQIQELQQTIEGDRQARAQEAKFYELAQQMTQDENVIRKAHADMSADEQEEYIGMVYDLAGDSGDLHAAAARLDGLLGLSTSRYVMTKEGPKPPSPLPGAGVIAQEDAEPPHTLEEGHERAMAAWRREQAAQPGM